MVVNLELIKNKKIESERLILRPVTLEDAPDMFDYASDEETTRYVFERHQTIKDTEETIGIFFLANPIGKYAIELRSEGKMIGTIDIRVDEANKKGEIGYALSRHYWGNGYMTEACGAILELAFEKLQLEKVYAMYDKDNPASGRLMRRLGMKKEGVARHNRIHKGKSVTDIFYGILKSEYDS
ncbi:MULTISPECIES: GNAT family N-acetyltransferase [unclassified Jeotgalibaca]|uniref:GNAT family N-acetyltransferase n=1 Tax=unclassified Jeotgalibaca TaxID=2621505 RepID=UPI003FD43ACF